METTRSLLRLAGYVLIEAHDDWQSGERRYLSESSMALLAPPGLTVLPTPALRADVGTSAELDTTTALTAQSESAALHARGVAPLPGTSSVSRAETGRVIHVLGPDVTICRLAGGVESPRVVCDHLR